MPEPTKPEPTKRRRSLTRGEWLAVAVSVVLLAVAIFVWVEKPSAPGASPAPVAAEAAAPATAVEGPAPTVADPEARTSLEALSANAAFRRWLAKAEDLVRRGAVTIDNLAQGVSPRKALAVLAPTRPFKAVRRGSREVIAPESYARYDEFADAVASLDAAAFARVYGELHPALEGAYRELGYPGGSLDAATGRALRRIEAAPVAEGDVALSPDRGVYAFADPRQEQLGDVEKHLLRMGPRNTRLLQEKARALRVALNLPSAVAAH